MKKTVFIRRLKAYAACRRAATAIEYALIGSGIAVAIVAVVYLLGDDVAGLYTAVRTALSTAASG